MEKSLLYELKSLNCLIIRKLILDSKEKGGINITPTQGKIMMFLNMERLNNHVVIQKDIEEHLAFRRSTISDILCTMEKNGLIVREKVDTDGRVKVISLTRSSVDMVNEINEKGNLFENIMLKGIDCKELDTFYDIINRIKKNLEGDSYEKHH